MDKNEISQKIENELKKILIHFTLKKEITENYVTIRAHVDTSLDNSQLKSLLNLGDIGLRRSGTGLTIRITKLIG